MSTHYVVLAHVIPVPAGFEIPGQDDQHEALRGWPLDEAAAEPAVHRFTKDDVPWLQARVAR